MECFQVINHMAARMGYKTYLEIGVELGLTIKNVNIQNRDGVDPHKLCEEVNYQMTSDEFFERYPEKRYDCIFIDGHHNSEFVCRDVNNALKSINENGVVFMHDCFPNQPHLAVKMIARTTPEWCGDGFKVVRSIVSNYSDSIMSCVVNTDYGVGMLLKLKKDVPKIEYNDLYRWEDMIRNPEEQINLISIEKFYRKFPSKDD